MPSLSREALFNFPSDPPPSQYVYALALLCNIVYYPHNSWILRWGTQFGFDYGGTMRDPHAALPNWAYAKHPDGAVIAIAGFSDFSENGRVIAQGAQVRRPAMGAGHVHSYVAWAVTGLGPRIKAQMDLNTPPSRLVFTGHGMGAAIAIVLAQWFQINHPSYNVVSYVGFNSPKPADWAWRDQTRTFRVYNIFSHRDLIHLLPPSLFFGAVVGQTGAWFPRPQNWGHPRDWYALLDNGELRKWE